jgi:hypothetical protein
MNLRKTIILACVLLAALAYIYKVQLPKDEAKAAEGKIFSGLEREALQSIKISRSGQEFTLKNLDPRPGVTKGEAKAVDLEALAKWEFAETPGADPDRTTLNTLITALLGFSIDAPLPAKDLDPDLSVYGLKAPALTLEVTTNSKPIAVSFGKENEYVHKRYFKIGGKEDVYLVPTGLFAAADKSKNEFRNKAPLDFVDSDLQNIQARGSAAPVKLQIDDKYEWQIVEPAKYTANNTVISALTRDIRAMRAVDFIDGKPNLSDFGLDKPAVEIDLTFKESAKRAPLHLAIGKHLEEGKERAYLSISGRPSIFRLEENSITQLDQPLESFRERQLFKFATDQAVQLDFVRFKEGPLSLVRTGGSWTVNSRPADENFVREILGGLSELRADGFPADNRDYGFSNPRLKLVLRLESTDPDKKTTERTLVIGDSADKSKDEARYYAAADGLNEPFIISKEAFKRIYPREEVLVRIEPTPAPTAAAPIESKTSQTQTPS